jgi:Ni/Co efflux regulator RcnB
MKKTLILLGLLVLTTGSYAFADTVDTADATTTTVTQTTQTNTINKNNHHNYFNNQKADYNTRNVDKSSNIANGDKKFDHGQRMGNNFRNDRFGREFGPNHDRFSNHSAHRGEFRGPQPRYSHNQRFGHDNFRPNNRGYHSASAKAPHRTR